MTVTTSQVNELPVTFHPALYLQRRGWVLDTMRREAITEVLDIGCGEGELLLCLCNSAPWLTPPPLDVLPPPLDQPQPQDAPASPPASAEALAELHCGILHPIKVAGLDISAPDLRYAVQFTQPPAPECEDAARLWHSTPIRWEPLQAEIWQGGLEHVNPAFVGIECIVAAEVIEHLSEDVLDRFAPVVLGAYHPRILLITTPSFTFNARFTAPHAPPEARSGWRDPTGRTERVFRHHDHKFEWTPSEFKQWCTAIADEWGYTVKIDGVGKAREADEWGRDEELGWASQVAAFARREGGEWEERRAKLWGDANDSRGTTNTMDAHQLLASHHHPAHAAARQPQPLDVVGDLILSKMVEFRDPTILLTEMWFEWEVQIACGGWVDWFVRAIEAHDGLALQKASLGISEAWFIKLDPTLHHLFPAKSRSDSWSTPPESDEVGEPWDDKEEDSAWSQHGDGVAAEDGSEGPAAEEGWGHWNGEDGGWGEPETDSEKLNANWGRPETDLEKLNADWGRPETNPNLSWGTWDEDTHT